MMAGPQIISSFMLITGKNPVKSSLAYVAAVLSAASIGTIALTILGSYVDPPDNNNSSISMFIQSALIGLLIFMSLRTYFKRADIKQPAWMGTLREADPKQAFKLGLTLIFLMPSDIMIMLTVAVHLSSTGASFATALPFIITTGLIAALPLIFYLIFYKKTVDLMPGINNRINNYSWLIQIIIYIFFIFLIWK